MQVRSMTLPRERITFSSLKIATFCLLASLAFPLISRTQTTPKFQVTTDVSTITFFVKSSVNLEGKFNKWNATLTFTSPDVSTGVLDIKIQAASVDTGSGFKDDKLKSKDFFDVKQDPFITFRSTKMVQTGPNTFDVPGTFTIRGVSKPEALQLTDNHIATGFHDIKGVMAFDRKDFGMDSGIPFIRIADRVEVTIDIKAKRLSGSPLVYKQ
jgi:polyisoprenoid-binding protein YceI